MNSLILVQVSTSNIPVNTHGIVFLIFLLILNHVKSVGDDIRVIKSPGKWLDFLNGDESTEVVNFCLGVHAISLLSREVEEFGAIVDLFPKSFLHAFFGLSQSLIFSEIV